MFTRSLHTPILFVVTFCLSSLMFAQTVAATLAVGSLPNSVAVDNTNGLLHVVNGNGNSVSSYNLATRTLTHTTAVGSSPAAIAVSSSGLVYVASYYGTVSIINPATSYSVVSVSVCTHPTDIAVNPVNGKVYIPCYAAYPNNFIYIIDPAHSNATSYVFPATPYAFKAAIDQSNGTVYVASTNGSRGGATSVTAINPSTSATTSIPVGAGTNHILVNSATHVVYALNASSNTLTVIVPSGSTFTTSTITLSGGPTGLTLDASGKVYIPINASITVLDPAHSYAASTITLPAGASGIAYDAGANTMTTYDATGGTASVIKLSTLATTLLTVGSYPYAVAASASRSESYVVNQNSNTVSVITD